MGNKQERGGFIDVMTAAEFYGGHTVSAHWNGIGLGRSEDFSQHDMKEGARDTYYAGDKDKEQYIPCGKGVQHTVHRYPTAADRRPDTELNLGFVSLVRWDGWDYWRSWWVWGLMGMERLIIRIMPIGYC